MKHLRKSILTLLALTLFGGAGAWAQEEVLLTTITATSLTTYSQSPDGIVTVTLNNIGGYNAQHGWLCNDNYTGTVTVEAAQGYTITLCVFRQNPSSYPNRVLEDDLAPFTATLDGAEYYVYAETSHGDAYGGDFMNGISSIEVYGYAPAQEIELTKSGANQWTLGQAPDYDLELQVEYYEAHALKNIPAGWTVMVNGVPQQTPYQGDSLMITETDSVTLVPPADVKPNVKSVTLADDVVLVTIDGITLDITGCTTWADIIARNPSVLEDDEGWVAASGRGVLDLGGDIVETSHPYNPAQQSNYTWVLI